ncbi:MAG: hypothetical protein HY053_00200 [Proteobacteria bacterium]|nr:hypothetical protein [Pseudomonadota bacterium]
MTTPYVSIAFTNRNDNYGGDLDNRIRKFIEYYAYFSKLWPGLFEFVICDYNPPPDKPKLPEAFAWKELGHVKHVEVPPEVHAATGGPKARKMLDYTGRNVAARHGSGEYTLVLNQDIFVSRSILQFIAARKLQPGYFYRADRCDFNFDPCRQVPPEKFEEVALANTFVVHRRHVLYAGTGDPAELEISRNVTPENIDRRGTYARVDERVDDKDHIVYGDGAAWRLAALRHVSQRNAPPSTALHATEFYQHFFLHTNAGGDFILAPRQAFFDIHGMPETSVFYMHLDSYALVQLFAAGYVQALFIQPHRVYHADHDRSGRLDFKEGMSFTEHETEFSKILRGERDYRVNDADWGMEKFNLPVSNG